MKTSNNHILKTNEPKTKLLFFICMLFLGLSTFKVKAQTQSIPIDSVENYVGKTVKICDKVYGTHVSKGEKKTTSLNLGSDFPNQKLTVVIFESDLPKFSYTPSIMLIDKNVCVTGKVMTYKDKPQIIVNDPKSLVYE